MKIRKGFVSNSSSASFTLEVKGEKEKIFNSLYENIEYFQDENYKKLLEEALKWEEKKLTGTLSESERRMVDFRIEDYTRELKNLSEYVKKDWYEIQKIEDPEEKSFAEYLEKQHIENVVKGVLRMKRWCCNYIDDGYISFSDSTIMYNGWEDIAHRKALVEMTAFFMFMKYEVRTRIECELQ